MRRRLWRENAQRSMPLRMNSPASNLRQQPPQRSWRMQRPPLPLQKHRLRRARGRSTETRQMADEQERELIKQREEAEKKLEEAQEQAKSGEEELEEQIANFPQTREETLAAATIDGKVTKEMIQTLLQAQNFDMPAGYVTQDDTQYLVRVGDAITDPEELKNLILFDPQIEGMDVVALQDVADIEVTDNGEETYAKINGNDGLILSIQKQNTYSTSEVSDAVNEALDSIMETDSDIHFTALMDQGEYIHIVIWSVLEKSSDGRYSGCFDSVFILKGY